MPAPTEQMPSSSRLTTASLQSRRRGYSFVRNARLSVQKSECRTSGISQIASETMSPFDHRHRRAEPFPAQCGHPKAAYSSVDPVDGSTEEMR